MSNSAAHGRRRRLVFAMAGTVLLLPSLAWPQTSKLDAPNVVVISTRLVTSGQPTASSLGALASQGFGAVIYLAPPTVSDAVPGEQSIVERQGLAYVNIPIKFDNPTEDDFDALRAALEKVLDRKVLVHCQINLRASTMVFLYRVIAERVPADQAYQAVAGVWTPEGLWRALVVDLMRKNGTPFEPY